jgi:uncharacterized membrane protein YadS
MLLNPIESKYQVFNDGVDWTSKKLLHVGIIFAGISLSFA